MSAPCACHGPKAGILLRFDLEGFHHYPGAPREVAFLAARHRHLFRFELTFTVSHDNRDLEFFMASAEVRAWIYEAFGTWPGEPIDFGAMSCEMIARRVMEGHRVRGCTRVEVWEDGENGGYVTA